MKAIFPGSFDPLTLGHLDLIERGLRFADELVIAVMVNPDKKGFFTADERVSLIDAACRERGLSRYKVVVDSGLLVDLAKKERCSLVIRGVRNTADLDSESSMARANALLSPGLETIFLPASQKTMDISSSLIRQIAALKGDVTHFVPTCVKQALKERFDSTTTPEGGTNHVQN